MSEANTALDAWFGAETSKLTGGLAREIETKEDWLAKKDEYRRQLAEMLGLDPMPERTELKATKTGEFEHEGVMVEKWHFQSMPGLYVTANFYRPKEMKEGEKLPAVLYLCGHSEKLKDGISYGNKAGYEHHGMWYAKHGFVCVTIDTVQLGEIRGVHHGTFRMGRWWWMSRGYTPAGVEAWSGIRALDFLETRAEVDKDRIGVTGRSGGGAYSWWVAALDERVKCAAPTAGITTLHNHVVDGKVSGHCDCMFMVNSYRWDYDQVAALVAPRPLLIANTDKDSIFPLDGVVKLHENVRRIYKLLGAEDKLGLHIAEGGHADVQPLNVGEFHWMTRFLQGKEVTTTYDGAAVKSIPMEKLRVFEDGLPTGEINTKVDEVFVPQAAALEVPKDETEWAKWREGWMGALKSHTSLRDKTVNAELAIYSNVQSDRRGAIGAAIKEGEQVWMEAGGFVHPSSRSAPGIEEGNMGVLHQELTDERISDGLMMKRVRLFRDADFLLEVYLVHRRDLKLADLDLVVLNVLDEQGWKSFADTFGSRFAYEVFRKGNVQPDEDAFASEKKMHQNFKWGMAYVVPRGVGSMAWAGTEKENIHRLRRFYLLGTTLESGQVWDIRCALSGLKALEGFKSTKLWLQASRHQAVNAVYASLFEDGIARVDLHEMPVSHREGPAYLNVLKYLDVPQAVAMAAERTQVVIYTKEQAPWETVQGISDELGWSADKERKRGLQLREGSGHGGD